MASSIEECIPQNNKDFDNWVNRVCIINRKIMVSPTTIISGVKCNYCKNILPNHTIKQHFNIHCRIHKCPHKL